MTKSQKIFSLLFLIFFTSIFTIQTLHPQSAYSQVFTAQERAQMIFAPAPDQSLFINQDIKFELFIPHTKPSKVQITQTPNTFRKTIKDATSPDYNFRSLKKSEDFQNQGTIIEAWYSFSTEGTFTIQPLSIMINDRRYSINFQKVKITKDPAKQPPKIVITYSNGKQFSSDDSYASQAIFTYPTGKKLYFTVNIQYALQVTQFNWEIPEDSIFSCTKTYEITEIKYREKNYSHDLIPVADFEWTQLRPGVYKMPKIKLTATSYTGTKTSLIFPLFDIDFSENNYSQKATENNDIFAQAFDQSLISDDDQNPPLSDEECRVLADSLKNEKRNFRWLAHLAGLLAVAALVLMTIFLKKKKPLPSLLFFVLLIAFALSLIFFSVKGSGKGGVCRGGSLYSLPQEGSKEISFIKAGTTVKISEKAGDWLYVEYGETGGWCQEDCVFEY